MTDQPPKPIFTDEERAAIAGRKLPGATLYEGPKFSTPLMEIQSSIMPLSIVFDVVAYLDHDHTEVEMFDLIQRLKAACE